MPHIDNPVGRCYLVLNEVWKTPPKEVTRKAFEQALGADEDKSEYYRKLAVLFRLPSEMRDEAAHLDAFGDKLLEAVDTATNSIDHWNSNNNIEWFRKQLDKSTLTILELSSKQLSLQRPQPFATDENLSEIVDALNTLEREIEGATISQAARDVLTAVVEDIREAVKVHDLDGGKAIIAQGHRLVGAVSTTPELVEQTRHSHDGTSKLGLRIRDVLLAVSLLSQSTTAVGELPQYVDNWTQPAIEHQADQNESSETNESSATEELLEAEVVEEDD